MTNTTDSHSIKSHNSDDNTDHNIILIDIDQITPNPHQPRLNCSSAEMDTLTKSIDEIGLLQPITVQKIDNHYQIIAGERRWRAHLQMDKQKIEAIVKHVDDKTNAIHALAENIAREDLSDYEIGEAIRKIKVNFQYKTELADMIGINRTDMYRYLAFDSLPDFIRNDLDKNPKLLSRAAAEQIKQLLKKHKNSQTVHDSLKKAWELLLNGKLEQTKISQFIEKELRNVFGLTKINNENTICNTEGIVIGQVKESKNYWTVQLNTNGINDDLKQRILNVIQQLFNETQSTQVSQVETLS